MRLHGIDVESYSESHSDEATEGARQYLEAFGCCPELLDALDKLKFKIQEDLARESMRRGRDLRKRRKTMPPPPGAEQPDLPLVIGRCPRCNGLLKGIQLPSCEVKDTGRLFYKECAEPNCIYYSEVLVDDQGDIREVEGG